MTRTIRTALALLLVSCLVSPVLAYEDLTGYKTWSREKLLSNDLNNTFTRINDGLNDVRGMYDDAGAVHDVKQTETDTLDSSSLGKIVVIEPLVSYSANDSLDYHRVNAERVTVDSLAVTTEAVFSSGASVNGTTATQTLTSASLTVTTADINAGTVDAVVGGTAPAAGTFTDLSSTGNTTIGNASGDALTFHPSAWTLSNGVTITGTWADLGAITTADINGGTIDATAIGGATPAAGAFTTGTFSSTLDVTGATTFGSDISVPATSKVYLNGQAGATYIHEIAAGVTGIYSSGQNRQYWYGSGMNVDYDSNANTNMGFNYHGYQNSTTQFRDLSIYDGKEALVAFFDGSSKATTLYGDILTDTDGSSNIGSAAAAWDSLFIQHAAVVGDLPYLDDRDDLALLDQIKGSGVIDSLTGMELVDDWSLPKEMMVLHRRAYKDTAITVLESYEDTTVSDGDTLVATVVTRADTTITDHAVGDLVLGDSGKPYYDLSATLGLMQGATRQLNRKVDALDASALEARVTALEGQVDNLQTIIILLGLAIGGGKAITLVRNKGKLKEAA